MRVESGPFSALAQGPLNRLDQIFAFSSNQFRRQASQRVWLFGI